MRLVRLIALLALVLLATVSWVSPAAACFPGPELLASMNGSIIVADDAEGESTSSESLDAQSVTEYRIVVNGSRGLKRTALAVAVRTWGPVNEASITTLKNREGPSGLNGCWTPRYAPLIGETSYLVRYGGSSYWVHGDVRLSYGGYSLGNAKEVSPEALRAQLDTAFGTAHERGPSLRWILPGPALVGVFVKGSWVFFDPLFGLLSAVLATVVRRRRRERARARARVRVMMGFPD